MAAITITASNVVPQSGAAIAHYKAGEAITAGQAVYVDTNNMVKLADVDLSATAASVLGVAVSSASAAGQWVAVCTEGPVAVGNVLTAAKVYVAGATGGAIHPIADLATGWRTSIVGYATSATTLYVKPVNSGIANA